MGSEDGFMGGFGDIPEIFLSHPYHNGNNLQRDLCFIFFFAYLATNTWDFEERWTNSK